MRSSKRLHRGIVIDPSTILPNYVDRLELDLAITSLTPTDYVSPFARR